MSGTLVRQLTAQDNADHAATAPVIAAYAAACRNLTSFQTNRALDRTSVASLCGRVSGGRAWGRRLLETS